jgi:RecB family exonuclease
VAPGWNAQVRFTEKRYSNTLQIPYTPSIETNDFLAGRMSSLLQRGLSPSALNTWIQCPLDFCFKYLLGLGEQEEVRETLDAAETGSAAHLVLESFYRDFIGGYPAAEDYLHFKATLDRRMDEAFSSLRRRNTDRGYNLLVRHMLHNLLQSLATVESEALQQRGPAILIALEERLEYRLPAALTGGQSMGLRGTADRIQERAGHTEIIDYKTGKVEEKKLILKPGTALHEQDPKAIQLLCYQLMYCRSRGVEADRCSAGIVPLLRPGAGTFWLEFPEGMSPAAAIDSFESQLAAMLTDMTRCHTFAHSPDAKFCAYCDP